MPKKFVINDGRLVMGEVRYHNELCSDNGKTTGGCWQIIENKLYFYGFSLEFGGVTKEDVLKATRPLGIEHLDLVFAL